MFYMVTHCKEEPPVGAEHTAARMVTGARQCDRISEDTLAAC